MFKLNYTIKKPTSYRVITRNKDTGMFSPQEAEIANEIGKDTADVKYVPGVSSAIKEVKFFPRKNTASVKFMSSDKYYDFDVDSEDMKEFKNAPSKGRFVNRIWKVYNRKGGF